ncbi:MAG TPA: hypothetical protein VEH77_05580, partial [Roseiarcus sp.]|nr:hypothetical protein [Roseiarcus sp.]
KSPFISFKRPFVAFNGPFVAFSDADSRHIKLLRAILAKTPFAPNRAENGRTQWRLLSAFAPRHSSDMRPFDPSGDPTRLSASQQANAKLFLQARQSPRPSVHRAHPAIISMFLIFRDNSPPLVVPRTYHRDYRLNLLSADSPRGQ